MNSTHDVDHILAKVPVGNIRGDLLQWWSHSSRHFPWRETRDPYRVLIAETLLHRTRADQVVLIYERFIQLFPNVVALAHSTPEELTIQFYSSGLRWRWKLLHSMAVTLKERFGGEIPDDFRILISLPGISHYIASAVRCFAFGYPDVILDTNTVRVAGRLLGVPITDSSRRSRLFREILEALIDKAHPREFNFALIDFAASICRSKTPLHQECCLNQYCIFYKLNMPD